MSESWLFMSKLLPILVMPLTTSLALLIACYLLRRTHKTISQLAGSVGFVCLLLFSTPIVSDRLVISLESQYVYAESQDSPPFDIVILLSGGINAKGLHRPSTQLGPGADRLRMAHRIYMNNKTDLIWLAGEYPTEPKGKDSPPHSVDLLESWGIPKNAILGEAKSRNTFENAREFSKTAVRNGWDSFALITSASHMPRAMQQFRSHGLEPIPIPSDHWIKEYDYSILKFIPQAEALNNSSKAIREYLGILVYALVR